MPSTAEKTSEASPYPYQLGVIGLGKMAQALLKPLLDLGIFKTDQVVACVASQASAQDLQHRFNLQVGLDPSPCLNASVLLLAIKPQQLERLLQHQAFSLPAPSNRPLLISVLAGIKLESLQGIFPDRAVVRAVPNTPVLVREGLVGVTCGAQLTKAQHLQALSFFKPVGEVLELPENQLDAFLALTASGPAFAALVVEGLADGAVAAGLPRQAALELAIKMLRGSALLMEKKGLHPAQLKDMVSSPGGTTIAGLRELERCGVRSALMEAVVKAAERSVALA
jgi:pyrroline-5-carboxylate reductase